MRKKKTKKKVKYNREIIGILVLLLGFLSGISLFSDKTGIIGVVLRNTYFTLMGFGAYIFPLVITGISILFLMDKLNTNNRLKSIYLLILFLCFLIFLDVNSITDNTFTDRILISLDLSKDGVGGGIIGSVFGYVLLKLFGSIGSYIIIGFIGLITILLITEVKIAEVLHKIKFKIKSNKINKTKATINTNVNSKTTASSLIPDSKQEVIIKEYDSKSKKNTHKELNNHDSLILEKMTSFSNYTLPSLDLLNDIEKKQDYDFRKEVINNAKKIEETMQNFGIDSKIIQIDRGPTITCYELQPAPGVKVSRIVNLSNDLALSLAASDIRIVAPIPGKAAVGIEVPNRVKDDVTLKEIIQSEEYLALDSNIPLALGKDITGKTIISSIDKMPHLLIAGATGSGKSVCINTIIMSILYKAHPDDVKLLLIDPKVVELNIYNGIPHLLIPVVTDPKKAAMSLSWAVTEMERRYKLFANNNVRDIKSYNSLFADKPEEKLPNIVIIIDELADLMMVAAQEIEDYICRLAQMARAAGMYLIIATQRPSVDVITGTIKANIPSRISFAVSSQIDSRTILDMSGAEKLLGKGDMLFFPSNLSKPIRVQGAFVSDEEVKNVVDFLKAQNMVEYDDEVISTIENEIELNSIDSDVDELLTEAISLVVDEGQASISLLQRRLKIGYARAARIIDQMEERGIVGGYEGSKPRKVLVSKEELDSLIEER
ncbi:MAG: DNA translocase FtsK [Tissierellia bacterium]|nr:DNA translocase FtsK [Tissierellia bacterium]